MLIKDLQGQIQQAYTAEIQDNEVLHEDYIRRVLHLRKVTITAGLQIRNTTSTYFQHAKCLMLKDF